MNYCKRIIVLSKVDNTLDEGLKGFLSLEQTGQHLKCVFKSFSLTASENLQLGIEIDEVPLHAVRILKENTASFIFSLNQELKINGKINVVCLLEQSHKPILFGSTYGESLNELDNLIIRFKRKNGLAAAVPEVAAALLKPQKTINAEELFVDDENLEELIDYHVAETEEETELKQETAAVEKKREIEEDEEKEEFLQEKPVAPLFYTLVQEQVEEMFLTFPREEVLEEKIENSKWVHVDYDNGLYYCLGLLFLEGKVKYICYAVPSDTGFTPPEELKAFCQWLPLDENTGYYMMYQNAETGENIVIE